jgi:hypothetical protein
MDPRSFVPLELSNLFIKVSTLLGSSIYSMFSMPLCLRLRLMLQRLYHRSLLLHELSSMTPQLSLFEDFQCLLPTLLKYLVVTMQHMMRTLQIQHVDVLSESQLDLAFDDIQNKEVLLLCLPHSKIYGKPTCIRHLE